MGRVNFSLRSSGVKAKVRVAFYLMSVLPLLISAFLISNYILPKMGHQPAVITFLVISAGIALTGFFVIKEMVDRILAISEDAKVIASGDTSHTVETDEVDEIGELGHSLNLLMQHVRSSMDELKGVSDRTTEFNIDIQKHILALSSLLQVSALITQGTNLEEVLEVIIAKARLLAGSEIAFLLIPEGEKNAFAVECATGVNGKRLSHLRVASEDELFRHLTGMNKPLILDKDNVPPQKLAAACYEKFKLKNILIQPAVMRAEMVALMVIGNSQESFSYSKDDVELLELFARLVAVAIEHDMLRGQVKKLEIRDPLTALFNDAFIRMRLQEEIKRAILSQRPCGFVLLNVDNFQHYSSVFGTRATDATLKKIASLIKDSVGEIDCVGRIGDNDFAIILPEKNKRKVSDIAEQIRKKIEFSFSEEPDSAARLTVSGGISENPLDGITAEELIAQAKHVLVLAKNEGKNRIKV